MNKTIIVKRYFYCLINMKVYSELEMIKRRVVESRYEYLGSFESLHQAECFARVVGFIVVPR